MKIPYNLKQVREITITKQELIDFEEEVEYEYNDGKIHCPVHLSSGNEEQLIEIFKYIHPDDWVFCSWRNHLEALLHGIPKEEVMRQIYAGQSLGVHHKNPKFYSSAIVGGIIPIALGVAKSIQMKGETNKVWCFIGDMTFESGIFHESYKYAKNFDLPLQFVLEDNNLSTNTPVDETWGGKQDVPDDVIYYQYKSDYPHHGTGNWVLF
jgi:pyruvate dehydrogenase E1 component alpha subunit